MSSQTSIAHELGALDAISQRRAVRSYLPDLEPWSFVIIQDRACSVSCRIARAHAVPEGADGAPTLR